MTFDIFNRDILHETICTLVVDTLHEGGEVWGYLVWEQEGMRGHREDSTNKRESKGHGNGMCAIWGSSLGYFIVGAVVTAAAAVSMCSYGQLNYYLGVVGATGRCDII